jgi:hypothetical protein
MDPKDSLTRPCVLTMDREAAKVILDSLIAWITTHGNRSWMLPSLGLAMRFRGDFCLWVWDGTVLWECDDFQAHGHAPCKVTVLQITPRMAWMKLHHEALQQPLNWITYRVQRSAPMLGLRQSLVSYNLVMRIRRRWPLGQYDLTIGPTS